MLVSHLLQTARCFSARRCTQTFLSSLWLCFDSPSLPPISVVFSVPVFLVIQAAALLVSHIGSMVAGTARLSLAEGAVALSRRVEFDRTEVQEVLSSLGLGDAEDV